MPGKEAFVTGLVAALLIAVPSAHAACDLPVAVKRALALVGPQRTLGLVTHRTWFGKPGPDTGVIRSMARRYRERVKLYDWVHYAAPHPAWFINDGLHTTDLGSRKFAAFLAS